MAGTGQPANVQAYLDSHKISTLFEDLTSLLVKNLPPNPIEFLITKLEEKNKKKISTKPATTTGGKKPISTVGSKTGVTSARGKPTTSTAKTTTTTTGKPSSASTTSRSTTSSTRVGGAARTVSKTEPVKRSTTSTRPAVTKPTTAKSANTKTTTATPTAKATSKVPKSPSSSVGTKVGGATKKLSSSTSTATKTTAGKPKTGGVTTKSKSVTGTTREPKGKGKLDTASSSSEISDVVVPPKEEDDETAPVDESINVTSTAADGGQHQPSSESVVDDPNSKEKKGIVPDTADQPPPAALVTPSEDEDKENKMPSSEKGDEDIDEEVVTGSHDDSIHDDKEQPIEEDDDQDDMVLPEDSGPTLDMEKLMKQKRAKKLAKQGLSDKSHLTNLLTAANASKDASVISHECEEESEDEGLEVVESHEMLEEEGVVLSEQARRMSMKLPENTAQVELMVTVCARCAKIINADEESVVISSSKLSLSMDPGFDDSASQVIGTQVPFPQWDGTSSVGSEMSLKQKWAMTGQSATPSMVSEAEGTSDLTGQTQKTASDEESELKLPTAIDYVKPDDEDTVTSINED